MKRIVILGAMALTISLAVPMTVQAEENGTDMVLAAKSVAGEFKTALQEQPIRQLSLLTRMESIFIRNPAQGQWFWTRHF